MRVCDALIVGGGPAGSTCARLLGRAGWNVIVADRARFPRDKVCAGWLTPRVFDRLELTPAEYRNAGLTLQEISGFRTGLVGDPLRETRYPEVVSYAIRRCEFDAFLLSRAPACRLEQTPIATLRRSGDLWIVNDEIKTPVIVGAGGHFCPVARHLRAARDRIRPVVAKEAEFRVVGLAGLDRTSPMLWFCRDLNGYGWCVPKGEYLNVGLGHADARVFAAQFAAFVRFLEHAGLVANASTIRWRGHAYRAGGIGTQPITGDGVLLVGDAAGVAYPESGEGIDPSIESGLLAAQTLMSARERWTMDGLQPYVHAMRQRHPATGSWRIATAARAAIGRVLLGSPWFTRHVVLDRRFLRRTAHAA